MKIENIYSPNFIKKKRQKKSIKQVIIHYTGMQSERESIQRLCNPKSEVSCHILIGQNGKIYRLVQDSKIAWHAVVSFWGKYKNLNKNSIGIELVNKGHQFGYTKFKKKQISSLIKVCKFFINKYKIKKKNIIGHSDVAPLRKKDPGEKFPWKLLAKSKIGIWHDQKPNVLKTLREVKILRLKDKKKFLRNLKKIGYRFSNKKNFFCSQTIKAFQRHFRTELIDGIIDKECCVIAHNLSKKQ